MSRDQVRQFIEGRPEQGEPEAFSWGVIGVQFPVIPVLGRPEVAYQVNEGSMMHLVPAIRADIELPLTEHAGNRELGQAGFLFRLAQSTGDRFFTRLQGASRNLDARITMVGMREQRAAGDRW